MPIHPPASPYPDENRPYSHRNIYSIFLSALYPDTPSIPTPRILTLYTPASIPTPSPYSDAPFSAARLFRRAPIPTPAVFRRPMVPTRPKTIIPKPSIPTAVTPQHILETLSCRHRLFRRPLFRCPLSPTLGGKYPDASFTMLLRWSKSCLRRRVVLNHISPRGRLL